MNSKKDYSKLQKIVLQNLDIVREFFLSNIPNSTPSTSNTKILTRCDECGDKGQHCIINLDWGKTHCYRCGRSHMLLNFLDSKGLYSGFVQLVQSITHLSSYEILNMFKTHVIDGYSSKVYDNGVNRFIKDYGLLRIDEIPEAKQYALNRVYDNEKELESYYADDKYFYVPLFKNGKICSFMGRLYTKAVEAERYYFPPSPVAQEYGFLDPSRIVGYLDDVSTNLSSNIVYVCEGYFDAYSINYSYQEPKAICLFGKSVSSNIMEELRKHLPLDTKLVLTLDSSVKDVEIHDNIKKSLNTLKKSFQNLYVTLLPAGDTNDILLNNGPSEVIDVLENNIMSFAKYSVKYSTIKTRKKNSLNELYEFVNKGL